MLSKKCKLHLKENDMTAFEHLKFAWGLAWTCCKAMVALLIHGLAPRWFDHYASDCIKEMHHKTSDNYTDVDL